MITPELKKTYQDYYQKMKVEHPEAYKEMKAEESTMIRASKRELCYDPIASEHVFHEAMSKRDGIVTKIPMDRNLTRHQRKVLDLLQSNSLGDVAAQLHITRSAVLRVIKRIKKRAGML